MRQLQSSLLQGMVPGRKRTTAMLMFIFLNVFSINLFAQSQQPVTGTVSSKGSSLPGVTVTVKGSSVTTQTDAQGKFSIDAPADGVLVFSHIGNAPKELSLNGQSNIQVELEPENVNLDEVVVVVTTHRKKQP